MWKIENCGDIYLLAFIDELSTEKKEQKKKERKKEKKRKKGRKKEQNAYFCSGITPSTEALDEFTGSSFE